MPIAQNWIISGLSTREQGGVNTTGFNYFDKSGGKMMIQTFVTVAGLLNCNPIPMKALNQILTMTQNVLSYYNYFNPITEIHGSDVICHFEDVDRIGVAWIELKEFDKELKWSYNYVCVDTSGQILLDLRDFRTEPWFGKENDLSDEVPIPVPQIDYFVDRSSNTWLVYNYDTDLHTDIGWRLGWMKLNSAGEIIVNEKFNKYIWPQFIVCSSAKSGFHLFPGYGYFNPNMGVVVSLVEQYRKRGIIPYPYPPQVCFEITGGNVLLVGYDGFSRQITYQLVSNKGKFVFWDTVDIEKVTFRYWEGIEVPGSGIYWADDLIHYLLSDGNFVRLILFDNDGKVVISEEHIKSEVLPIHQMPADAKRFMKISRGVVYYYGFDNKGNLYYWNSKKVEKE